VEGEVDYLGAGESIPWSFELFSSGLDILLPKMTPETFRVTIHSSNPKPPYEIPDNWWEDSATSNPFLTINATNVRTPNLKYPTIPI